jgi:hypothetical protein
MFNPSEWFDECERALADAEYLANRLARVAAHPDSDVTALRLGISALRAEFERARTELSLGDRRVIGAQAPSGSASPWCDPTGTTDF